MLLTGENIEDFDTAGRVLVNRRLVEIAGFKEPKGITIGYRYVKAATANPVKSLRSE